ncbi:alkylated DNA repair protein alkB like protein 6 [Trypanosoma grayi]|uniref:alkylated DNA repair protein alkB like protein 6 n=1 Tax=Trypanosoma grayi TaxID=71804 RepID=UPI0004F466B0|nr:alkylated DNA repair protein alkB like protein 6 [Trypanosoma grayi]KEG09203.1 alkylated DNA repair protein alkB like protein 6 [Trypanosoma grayi]
MRRYHLLPILTSSAAAAAAAVVGGGGGGGSSAVPRKAHWRTASCALRHNSSNSTSSSFGNVEEAMKTSGFQFSTPNFSVDGTKDMDAAELVQDLQTSPVTRLDFVRDMYGPWLVLTEELQGELFIDHDRMVYLRPANGLGFGVGRIDVADACATGIAFTLQLESYTYPVTAVQPPSTTSAVEVTGLVKRVHASAGDYATFSLVATWRKKDGKSGNFNAAKLSPWDPATNAKPWEPKAELKQIFEQVFPKPLKLTSHIKRMQAARETSNSSGNSDAGGNTASLAAPYHMSLDQYRVGSVPDIYYIPNYISEEEEEQILDLVRDTPNELKTHLTKRTAQEWGCTMCDVCNKSFVADRNMPPWVDACNDMLLHDGIFTPSTFPNSVRVHEYSVGEGIAAHCDGPIYFPVVSVLSLSSPCVMFFYARREPHTQPMEHYNDTFRFTEGISTERPIQSVVLEPRSLLLFRGEAYHYYPHGTSDRAIDVLTPELAGEVVNRHLLKDKDVTEVRREHRVSITTRNLLPRCNHQPSRTEYGMKRAWYIYNQLPVPEPLVTPAPPHAGATTAPAPTPTVRAPAAKPMEEPLPSARTALAGDRLVELENKVDQLLHKQTALERQVGEMQQLMAAEATR